MSNTAPTLNDLLERGVIHLNRGSILNLALGPMPESFHFDRVDRMTIGLAVGDALGIASEGILPQERRRLHGEIRDLLPNRYAGGHRAGLPSDDTQLDKGLPSTFCLPADRAEKNTSLDIQEPVLDYVAGFDIKWRDGHNPDSESAGNPSNHLCDAGPPQPQSGYILVPLRFSSI